MIAPQTRKPKNHIGIAGRKKKERGCAHPARGRRPRRELGRVVVPRHSPAGHNYRQPLSGRERHAVPRHSPAGRGPRPPQRGHLTPSTGASSRRRAHPPQTGEDDTIYERESPLMSMRMILLVHVGLRTYRVLVPTRVPT